MRSKSDKDEEEGLILWLSHCDNWEPIHLRIILRIGYFYRIIVEKRKLFGALSKGAHALLQLIFLSTSTSINREDRLLILPQVQYSPVVRAQAVFVYVPRVYQAQQ